MTLQRFFAQTEIRRLPNGRTVIVAPDHTLPFVSVGLWVPAGSAHDPGDRTGLAHLTEHLMFKETGRLANGEFDRLTEELGADVNAATWLDWTTYYALCPRDALEEFMRLEAERFWNFSVGADSFEIERDVVLNERTTQVEDDPDTALNERLMTVLYPGHPYSEPTIGWVPHLKAVTRDDAVQFQRERYSAASIVLCGDITADDAVAMLTPGFGGQTLGVAPSRIGPPAPLTTPHREHIKLPVQEGRGVWAFPAPDRRDARAGAVADVLCEVLCGGEFGILYRSLVLDAAVASSVEGEVTTLAATGLYSVTVWGNGGEPLDVGVCERALRQGLEAVAAGKLADGQLEAAINRCRFDLLAGLRAIDDRAFMLGEDWVSGTGPLQVVEDYDALGSLNVEALAGRARALLSTPWVCLSTGDIR
jgi:zinc protease